MQLESETHAPPLHRSSQRRSSWKAPVASHSSSELSRQARVSGRHSPLQAPALHRLGHGSPPFSARFGRQAPRASQRSGVRSSPPQRRLSGSHVPTQAPSKQAVASHSSSSRNSPPRHSSRR